MRAFANVLQSEPWSSDLDAVNEEIRTDPRVLGATLTGMSVRSVEEHVALLSNFRGRAIRTWWLENSRPQKLVNGRPVSVFAVLDAALLVEHCSVLLGVGGVPPLAADLRPGMITAFAVVTLNVDDNLSLPTDPQFLDFIVDAGQRPDAALCLDLLWACCSNDVISISGLCAVMILGRPGHPWKWHPGSARDIVVNLGADGARPSLLETLLKELLANLSPTQHSNLDRAIPERLQKLLEKVSDRDYARGKPELEKVYKEWVREMTGQPSGILGRAKSLFKKE